MSICPQRGHTVWPIHDMDSKILIRNITNKSLKRSQLDFRVQLPQSYYRRKSLRICSIGLKSACFFMFFYNFFSMAQKSNIIVNPTTVGSAIESAQSRPPSGKSRNSDVVRGTQKCLEKFSSNTTGGKLLKT